MISVFELSPIPKIPFYEHVNIPNSIIVGNLKPYGLSILNQGHSTFTMSPYFSTLWDKSHKYEVFGRTVASTVTIN